MSETTEKIDLPDLECICPDCKGTGGSEERGRWYHCLECGGGGYIPTVAGERVVSLLRHQFGSMMRRHRDAEE